LSSRVWLAGFIASGAALVLLTISFSLVPLSVAQAVYGAGLVILIGASHYRFREPIRRVEVAGLVIVVIALALTSLSLNSNSVPGEHGSVSLVCGVSASLLLLAVLVLILERHRVLEQSVAFGLSCGITYGVAGLDIKGAAATIEAKGLERAIPLIFQTPYPYILILSLVFGLLVFQTGIQRGRVIIIAPISNVVAGVCTVAVGMALFHEPLPTNAVLAAFRLAGFSLTLLGGCFFASTAGETRQAHPRSTVREGSRARGSSATNP
jgi:multidrug transporter EmrE-like cation transporter